MLNIHQKIKDKLKYFNENKKVPNIIFNGLSGSGKSTILNEFIHLIYNNDIENIKNYVMYVNCSHFKGIKFIREELKFFAKMNITNKDNSDSDMFKSIILLNGDKLTIDAQSALRRCIELFSHNTRFFITVEDKNKLLHPILSRFCEIYIPEVEINNVAINLYKYNLNNTFKLSDIKQSRLENLKKTITKQIYKQDILDETKLISFMTKLYEKGYNGLDLIELIENDAFNQFISLEKKYELLITYNKVRNEIRNEKMLMLFIFNFTFLFGKEIKLENLD
jgi:DNA polymerase III delta prime subunit